ncbi:MAG: flavin reductase family protein [Armatimonadia bacterium]
MAKVEVSYDYCLPQMLQALSSPGLLLVSVDEGRRPNAMTIGWAQIGIIWSRKIMTVMVRPSRYTYKCIEATKDFTVCVPYADLAEQVMFCGTESGRTYDKFAECGFTVGKSELISSPYIEECGLCYQCQVVNYTDFVPEQTNPTICEQCYPGGDFHRAYFGQILNVVADEDFETRFG